MHLIYIHLSLFLFSGAVPIIHYDGLIDTEVNQKKLTQGGQKYAIHNIK